MKSWIIMYDICSPQRLARVARLMEAYGIRLQKSVFQCDLTPEAHQILKKKLGLLIHKKKDSIVFVPVCSSCQLKVNYRGTAKLFQFKDFIIL